METGSVTFDGNIGQLLQNVQDVSRVVGVEQGSSIFWDTVDFIKKSVGGSIAGVPLSIPSEMIGLIELQRQMQIEMQTVSMVSNIEKSKHESKMAAIRNVRSN